MVSTIIIILVLCIQTLEVESYKKKCNLYQIVVLKVVEIAKIDKWQGMLLLERGYTLINLPIA